MDGRDRPLHAGQDRRPRAGPVGGQCQKRPADHCGGGLHQLGRSPPGQQIASLAVFVVIGTLGLLTPLAVLLCMGERATAVLSGWKDWTARHNVAVMAVLFFVLGAKLLGDGIGILVS